MERLAMCRICLATDLRLSSIARNLQDMYEILTAMTFQRKDKRPLVACYICHARLRNCYRLRTSCLHSEELLTEMQSSDVIVQQDIFSTTTFRAVLVLHLSMGHALEGGTECHIKEECSQLTSNEPDQQNTEDIKMEPQEEYDARIEDNIECSHLEDPLDEKTSETSDDETDAEDIKLETEDITIEENELNGAGTSSQSVPNICPKVVKIILKRIVLNDTRTGTPIVKKSPHMATKTESVNKNDFIDQLPVTDNIHENIDKVRATSHKHRDNNKNVNKKKKKEKQTVCSKTSLDWKGFRSKTRTHIHDKRYQCYVCNKYFKRKYHLKRHLAGHTGGIKSDTCNVCQKHFIQTSNLVSHLCDVCTYHSVKQFHCDVCKKCFKYKYLLRTHIINTHTGDKPYKCDVCKKSFIRKDSLECHTRVHTGDKPYVCDVCKKGFYSKTLLISHIRCVHAVKPFTCNICKKCFTKKYQLIAHTRKHTGDKPFMCDVCKKCFTTKAIVTQHIQNLHTCGKRDKPTYTCDICKKCYNRKDRCVEHTRLHSDAELFRCDVCKKCFTRKETLVAHTRKHTGDTIL